MGSLDCEVCLENFDEDKHLPRCLSCGHTLCTSCLWMILYRKASLKCPFCRLLHTTSVSLPEEIPVNYSVMKTVRGDDASSEDIISTENPRDWFKSVKKDIAKSADELLCDFENDLNKLRRLHKRLESKEQSHALLLARIPDYVSYLKKIGAEFSAEKEAAKKALEQGEIKREKLRTLKEHFQASKSLVEVSDAHLSIVKCHSNIEEWRNGVQPLHYSDIFKKYKAAKKVTAEALTLIPVKEEEFSGKEWKNGPDFLLYFVAFGCGIIAAWWKVM